MNQMQTFEQFLATQSVQVPIFGFLFNLLLAAILSFVLSRVYTKYGSSLSNRAMFSKNFMLITMATALVITIVKSSLALSLGLVGALSIVRFRTAIKEPEELAYMFLAIAIGLGLGADQRVITVVAIFVICGIMILRSYFRKTRDGQNLYLTIASSHPQKVDLEKVIEILKQHCSVVDVKRYDETNEVMEASFLVELDNFSSLTRVKTELQKLSNAVKVTFLDQKGIL